MYAATNEVGDPVSQYHGITQNEILQTIAVIDSAQQIVHDTSDEKLIKDDKRLVLPLSYKFAILLFKNITALCKVAQINK